MGQLTCPRVPKKGKQKKWDEGTGQLSHLHHFIGRIRILVFGWFGLVLNAFAVQAHSVGH